MCLYLLLFVELLNGIFWFFDFLFGYLYCLRVRNRFHRSREFLAIERGADFQTRAVNYSSFTELNYFLKMWFGKRRWGSE